MANEENNTYAQAGNGASRDAMSVRGYGMGGGGRQAAPSQPVPDPYQAQRAYGAPQPPAGQYHAPQPQPGQPPAYGQQGAYHYAGQRYYGMAQPHAAYVAPATSLPQQMPKKRRRVVVWVVLAVALVCIVAACLLAFTMCNGQSKRSGEAGQLEGKTEAEIQAELNRQVEEGMFNISIASTVQVPDGTSEGEFRIENVPGNPYLMQVVISRDDTGEEIYTTDMIEPNHHIQRDTLDVDLDPGSYECTATFFACDPDTEEVVGQAAAKVLVVVSG